MGKGWLAGVILGTFAISNLMMASENPVAVPAYLRITVYDQAHLTRGVTQTAFYQLRMIFRQAGIAIELVAGDSAANEASLFTYPGLPPKGHEQEAACRARRDIALKITSASPRGLRKTVLGIAAPLAVTGLNVRVFNDHVHAAALRGDRQYANVLSCTIAHEIGHVLLRSSDHAKWGLMSDIWSEHEYAQMAVAGVMFFTRDESERMLMNLRGIGCREVGRDRWAGEFIPVRIKRF
jgi:hypothetical protein